MNKASKRYLILLVSVIYSTLGTAQGYQALHGSPFTGSTAIFNNPAASVGSAYKWDLTLFSTQFKMSSNGPYLKNFSFANQDSTYLTMKQGLSSKFIHANMDLSFLNILYKIDNQKAVSFGIRGRTYNHFKSAPFNYNDSISSFNNFLIANASTPYIGGFINHSGWLEADLNYSQVLFENNYSRLSGGLTLQFMKGLSGAYMKLNKLSYVESKTATSSTFNFTDGSASLGYSANYDVSNFNDFYKNSSGALGLSLGVEYMTWNRESEDGESNNNINYDWKIGLSLMDLGANKFKYSANSIQLLSPAAAVTDAQMDQKLSGAADMVAFKDSLATIFTNNAALTGDFTVSNPTRLILNIDKNLGNHFYINGEMSMNFYSTSSYTKLRTRELNLLTITPRWETIGLGAYLPVQYNTQGQLWIGAAVKLGPLVLGIHNLGLLKKDPSLNGGGYLLLSIHPFNKRNVLSKMDCPQ